MRSDARKRLTEIAAREAVSKPQPHPDPAVCELIARAWDEGAHAAVDLHNTGTRMTLRAVIPFPSNPYRRSGS